MASSVCCMKYHHNYDVRIQGVSLLIMVTECNFRVDFFIGDKFLIIGSILTFWANFLISHRLHILEMKQL